MTLSDIQKQHDDLTKTVKESLMKALEALFQEHANLQHFMIRGYSPHNDGDAVYHRQSAMVNGHGDEFVVVPGYRNEADSFYVEEGEEDERLKEYPWLRRGEELPRLRDLENALQRAKPLLQTVLGTDWCLVVYRDMDGTIKSARGNYQRD